MVIFVATSEQPAISFATWYFHPHPWFEGWFLRTSWELVELLRTSWGPTNLDNLALLGCPHQVRYPRPGGLDSGPKCRIAVLGSVRYPSGRARVCQE
jgi:hypothetical protein